MTRGGQANEAGSVFRRSVAVYLAVRGLLGSDVPDLGPGGDAVPVGLAFETSEPTDDLTCSLEDGRRAFISAKREVGVDQGFRDTVAGWCRQVEEHRLADGDLLVLATSKLKGALADLPQALSKHQQGVELVGAREKAAFAALEAEMSGSTPEVRTAVLAAGRVLAVPASSHGVIPDDHVGGRLEGSLVDPGAGGSASGALAVAFHEQAAAAFGSTIDDWLRLIEAAGVTVYSSREGPLGAQRLATSRALDHYKRAVIQQSGRITLSLLAADLPEIQVPDLLDSLSVSTGSDPGPADDHDLMVAVRRWNRFVLYGLPGAGKSTALREIAAAAAGDEDAPIPVVVRLPRLVQSVDRPIGLHDLLADALAMVGETDRQSLESKLIDAAGADDMLLLLDALDETGDRAGRLVDQLTQVIAELHPGTGVIVASRFSASLAADRLGLPQASLKTPSNLAATLDQILDLCAERWAPAEERDLWLSARRAWLGQSKAGFTDLMSVPLLAVLMVIIAARAASDDLPRQRASLLHRAVVESVTQRERERSTPDTTSARIAGQPDAALLDGYRVSGSLFVDGALVSREHATSALRAHFESERWQQPPAVAEGTANDVLTFWDVYVGVFVSVDDRLSARSRVFVDIADALGAAGLDVADAVRWLLLRLGSQSKAAAVALAASAEPAVAAALLRIGSERGRPQATRQLADLVISTDVQLAADDLSELCRQLELHVDDAIQGRAAPEPLTDDGTSAGRFIRLAEREPERSPAWALTLRLIKLPLEAQAAAARDTVARQFDLPAELKTLAAALVAVRAARRESRPPTADELAAIEAGLHLPLPERSGVKQVSRRRFELNTRGRPPAGLIDLAGAAIDYVDVMGPWASEAIYRIGERGTVGSVNRFETALTARGVDTTPWRSAKWAESMRRIGKTLADSSRNHDQLLTELGAIAEPAELSAAQRWHVDELADLLRALGYGDTYGGELDVAIESDSAELRAAWISVMARAHGIDLPVAAAQAAWVSEAVPGIKGWVLIATENPSRPPPEPNPERLQAEDEEILLACLTAEADWIAQSAAMALIAMRTDATSGRFEALFDRASARRLFVLALGATATAASESEYARKLAASPEPFLRAAAATTASGDGLGLEDVYETLNADPDLSVRTHLYKTSAALLGSHERVPAVQWSCDGCGAINALEATDCESCSWGTRPDVS